jgi:endonuclease-8
MPEGPSLVILKEEVASFKGKKIIEVNGNSKENIKQLEGQKILDFKTWGKHFLICFKGVTLRIHFLLFGKYSVNGKKTHTYKTGIEVFKR